MKNSFQLSSFPTAPKLRWVGRFRQRTSASFRASRGFTLVETLAAVSLLSIAIVAPMVLTMQSISSAYLARDQITAFYLAQEAIESVHAIRDGQILQIALTPSGGQSVDLFGPLAPYANGQPFYIDATDNNIRACGGACSPLKTDGPNGTLYGYSGTTNTIFTRTVIACYVQANGCTSNPTSEMRLTVTVSWKTGSFAQRSFTISEDLYRWIEDGSGT